MKLCTAGLLALLGSVLAVFAQTAKPLPPSKGAPQIGQKAPDFTLPDSSGKPARLSDFVAAPVGVGADAKPSAWTLLIFYRGYW